MNVNLVVGYSKIEMSMSDNPNQIGVRFALPPPIQQCLVNPSPPCPLEWIKDFTHEVLENALIKGDIASFYQMWSDESKKCMTFVQFGRTLAHNYQTYGKFTRVGIIGDPQKMINDYWLMRAQLFVDDIEFFALISINAQKQLADFSIGRCCIYHPPEYINNSRFDRIVVNESDPRVVFSKPKNVNGQFPTALFIHSIAGKDVNLRMGFCFPLLDYEFLPSNGIGLLRSDFSKTMIETNDPIIAMTSKLMETVMMNDDSDKIFLILHSYAANYITPILKKFPDIVSGIIFINPCWNAPPGSPIQTMTVEQLPKDIPMLALSGGYDSVNPPGEFSNWENAMKKVGGESCVYDSCDYFLLACPQKPIPQEYSIFERHISDVPLRKIAQFIKAHSK